MHQGQWELTGYLYIFAILIQQNKKLGQKGNSALADKNLQNYEQVSHDRRDRLAGKARQSQQLQCRHC